MAKREIDLHGAPDSKLQDLWLLLMGFDVLIQRRIPDGFEAWCVGGQEFDFCIVVDGVMCRFDGPDEFLVDLIRSLGVEVPQMSES